MVADDDPAVRLLCEQSLERTAEFEVASFANGAALLDELAERRPDIVLLDVEMPGIDGYETCRAIRSGPHGADLPIIMITGNDDADSVNRAYTLGATDFVSKQIPWTIFPHRIRYVLRASTAFKKAKEAGQRIRTMLQGRRVRWRQAGTFMGDSLTRGRRLKCVHHHG